MPGDDAPPLDPSGGAAHAWLQRELAKPAYADQRSWLQRLWDWARDRLDDLLQGVGGALPLYVLIPLLLVILGIVVFALSRLSGGSARKQDAAEDGVLTEVDLTARQLRERAGRSSAAGAHSAAFVDYFRALARRAEERALLLPQPGRTAHEVGTELEPYFPGHTAAIRSAATFFDQVRYGGTDATAADVSRIEALDRELDDTRPQHAAPQQVTA
ncbi:MAG TPA: DUF4129 domain-containing protein [Flexivirga sp.]|uniref:DUF4129 domain-containing protein n=1 Tax=Flexivirga sp. TaxID=1962927 RepID=UPI002CEFB37B|nr:DUF4129 domain-containing protein [Flexivirga sp.]HWC23394.1 DUF4129 domain-containing protein [Flexivirga sp.]